MLEDAIEILTNQLIEEDFKNKSSNNETKIVMIPI